MAYETDQGTLQLIGQLTRPGATRLVTFLERCDALRAGDAVEMMRLSEATPGKGDEPVSLRYEDLLDGLARPAHLEGVGTPNSDTSRYAYDYGAIRLKLVKAGVQAECHAGPQCLIEKGEVHYEHPEDRLDAVREAL